MYTVCDLGLLALKTRSARFGWLLKPFPGEVRLPVDMFVKSTEPSKALMVYLPVGFLPLPPPSHHPSPQRRTRDSSLQVNSGRLGPAVCHFHVRSFLPYHCPDTDICLHSARLFVHFFLFLYTHTYNSSSSEPRPKCATHPPRPNRPPKASKPRRCVRSFPRAATHHAPSRRL